VIGLFYGDYFGPPRQTERRLDVQLPRPADADGNILPIIINNSNFQQSDPSLLSFDDP